MAIRESSCVTYPQELLSATSTHSSLSSDILAVVHILPPPACEKAARFDNSHHDHHRQQQQLAAQCATTTAAASTNTSTSTDSSSSTTATTTTAAAAKRVKAQIKAKLKSLGVFLREGFCFCTSCDSPVHKLTMAVYPLSSSSGLLY